MKIRTAYSHGAKGMKISAPRLVSLCCRKHLQKYRYFKMQYNFSKVTTQHFHNGPYFVYYAQTQSEHLLWAAHAFHHSCRTLHILWSHLQIPDQKLYCGRGRQPRFHFSQSNTSFWFPILSFQECLQAAHVLPRASPQPLWAPSELCPCRDCTQLLLE